MFASSGHRLARAPPKSCVPGSTSRQGQLEPSASQTFWPSARVPLHRCAIWHESASQNWQPQALILCWRLKDTPIGESSSRDWLPPLPFLSAQLIGLAPRPSEASPQAQLQGFVSE